MQVEKNPASEEIKQQAKYKLFVEGTGESVDKVVINALLDNAIDIDVMGAAYSIKSVADALFPSHPYYYFLVDRDDEDESTVEASWKNFPDSEKRNLLYWKRKEIENYFLIPDFICCSEHFTGTKADYIKKLEEAATRRVYLDIANLVITHLRNTLKSNWVQHFNRLDDFQTKEAALQQFDNLEALNKHITSTAQLLETGSVKKIFEKKLQEILGAEKSCIAGKGKWEHFLSGKELLNVLIQSSMFAISDLKGNFLQGQAKVNEILKALVKKGENLPEDFVRLKAMIKKITAL